MKRQTFLWAVLFVVTLAACGDGNVDTAMIETSMTTVETSIDVASIGDPMRGREIATVKRGYPGGVMERNGGYCHTFDENDPVPVCQATDRPRGPRLEGISLVAGDQMTGMSAEEYRRASIMDPAAHIASGDWAGSMPTGLVYLLTDEQIDNLVTLLLTL